MLDRLSEHVTSGSHTFLGEAASSNKEPGELTQYNDWLRAGQSDDRGSIPGGGLGIFLFDTMSRQALGPTQPPV
jgi:hypothetical protein